MEQTGTDFEVRSYRSEDEPRVLELLQTTVGAWPGEDAAAETEPADFFRWKHLSNPFGQSHMMVAEADGRIIAFRAMMQWRLTGDHLTLRATQGVDVAVHREYWRRGVFWRLAREADEVMRKKADLVFGVPNDNSLPVSLKLGREIVGRLPRFVRVRRPVRFARALHFSKGMPEPHEWPVIEAETATEALRDGERISLLLDEERASDPRLATARDLAYLRWRYTCRLDYRAIREERQGRLSGLAIFHVQPKGVLWDLIVAELIVSPGDRRTARRLLRRVADTCRVDRLSCYHSPGSSQARAAARYAFLRSRGSATFVSQAFRDDVSPDPIKLSSWRLSLGDLELF